MIPKIALYLLALQGALGLSIPKEGIINEEILDGEGKVVLKWEVIEDRIQFEIEAETLGFIGFGISPSGTMLDADIFIVGVKEDGTVYSGDYHGIGETFPVLDSKQDWILVEAREVPAQNKTFAKFSRLLNTCDDEDYPIGGGTNRLIWALGSTDTLGYHGPTSRGTKSTNLINNIPPGVDITTMDNFTVSVMTTMPPIDTSYWCTFHKAPLLGGKRHVVAFETILPTWASFQHTHHFVVFDCKVPAGSNQTDEEYFDRFTHANGEEGDHCHSTQTLPVSDCQSPLYIWAKGGKMMVFPDNVGFPIGEEGPVPRYYMLELHYDNPFLSSGLRFESGFAMYYTDDLRPMDAGLLALGQSVDIGLTVPPMTDDYKVVGHCSPDCTKDNIRPEGITVFASMMHAHTSGRKMKTRHFRGNVEQPWLDYDDHYDFDFQQIKNLMEPRLIMPGDQLSVECTYSSKWKNGLAVIGGYPTHEEMCQDHLWYYPKGGMGCMSTYDVDKHLKDFGVQTYHKVQEATSMVYYIDTPEELVGTFFDLVSHKFNWTKEFQDAYSWERLNGIQYSSCNGVDMPTKYPDNLVEYVPEDVCSPQDTSPTTIATTQTTTTPPPTTLISSTETGSTLQTSTPLTTTTPPPTSTTSIISSTQTGSTDTTTENDGSAAGYNRALIILSIGFAYIACK